MVKFFCVYFVLLPFLLHATINEDAYKKLKYRTNFGQCPARAAGSLSIKLIKIFEKKRSLRKVKELIVLKNLIKKHFLSGYKISFDPVENQLNLDFECSRPLMKAQVYHKDGQESYEAILVEDGSLVDPTYEALLRTEKKLTKELPYLALPIGNLGKEMRVELAGIMKGPGSFFKDYISEMIIGEDETLTVILSVNGQPSSAFLGREDWTAKSLKLKKIISYLSSKKKIPVIINLTNSKKVVVKFNDKN